MMVGILCPNSVKRVEFVPCHCRHMDVSDQAGSLVETARCKKIGCRRESLDGVTQRPQKSSHGIAKEFIVFDDRDQWRFGQAGLPQARTGIPVLAASNTVAPACERILREESHCSKRGAAKLWLISARGEAVCFRERMKRFASARE